MTEILIAILIANNWNEPTSKQYPTYIEKSKGKNINTPCFEDIHFVWRNNKPVKTK